MGFVFVSLLSSVNWKTYFLLCSGLNFLDLMVRQGTIDNPPKPPLVPGFECSGIVEAVGENSEGFEVNEMRDSIQCVTVFSCSDHLSVPDRG